MVSVKILSRYQNGFPGVGTPVRAISGGPLYPRGEVLSLIAANGEQSIRPWTIKCAQDIQKMALDSEDLYELFTEALSTGRFIGSEWCQQQPTGPWAACDAYSLIRREWMPAARRELDMEYYIKFAIGISGTILLLASCHPSN